MDTIVTYGGGDCDAELDEVVAQLGHRRRALATVAELRALCARGDVRCFVLDADAPPPPDADGTTLLEIVGKTGLEFVVVSSRTDGESVRAAFRAGARDYITRPFHRREFILRLGAVLKRRIRIACIGGGTGLYALLSSIRSLPQVLPISVVNMSDDGGSSGRLSASFAILPPGDVRKSLVALSNAPELMNDVMQYRFDRGEALKGHSLGNLILTALSELTGSLPQAVKALGDILNVQGIVLCAGLTRSTLAAEFEDGRVVRGESQIDLCVDRPHELRIRKIWLEPEPACDADACAAILAADVVTIGPGDLYTSVIATLAIPGIREAIAHTRARRVYICNLMTKPGETSNLDAAGHVAEILRYLGGDHLDYVITSSTEFSGHAIGEYASKHQHPVRLASPESIRRLTRAELLHADVGDEATLVRHDARKLQRHLLSILG